MRDRTKQRNKSMAFPFKSAKHYGHTYPPCPELSKSSVAWQLVIWTNIWCAPESGLLVEPGLSFRLGSWSTFLSAICVSVFTEMQGQMLWEGLVPDRILCPQQSCDPQCAGHWGRPHRSPVSSTTTPPSSPCLFIANRTTLLFWYLTWSNEQGRWISSWNLGMYCGWLHVGTMQSHPSMSLSGVGVGTWLTSGRCKGKSARSSREDFLPYEMM